jgi:hypothetical protein
MPINTHVALKGSVKRWNNGCRLQRAALDLGGKRTEKTSVSMAYVAVTNSHVAVEHDVKEFILSLQDNL